MQTVPDTTAVAPSSGFFNEILASGSPSRVIAGHIIETIVILVAAWFLIRLIDRIMARWMARFADLPNIHPGRQRAFTVGNLLSSSARYIIWPLAIITIISGFGVNVGALVATAGIAGIAVGFGAQTLVKDVLSGVFLLFDETIHVGDLITFNGQTGTVEHIGVRLIRMRRFDGELVMIPAGELRVFGNKSVDFARVIVEIGVSYEQHIDDILRVVNEVALAWAAEFEEIMLDDAPETQSITQFGDSAVTVRVIARVIPGEQYVAERALRLAIKRRFDESGIEIPFPRRTVYLREEKDLPPNRIP